MECATKPVEISDSNLESVSAILIGRLSWGYSSHRQCMCSTCDGALKGKQIEAIASSACCQ